MSRKRRHFTAEQKAQVVRRHLAGKEAVSDLADEYVAPITGKLIAGCRFV